MLPGEIVGTGVGVTATALGLAGIVVAVAGGAIGVTMLAGVTGEVGGARISAAVGVSSNEVRVGDWAAGWQPASRKRSKSPGNRVLLILANRPATPAECARFTSLATKKFDITGFYSLYRDPPLPGEDLHQFYRVQGILSRISGRDARPR